MSFESLQRHGLAYGGSWEEYAKDDKWGGARALDSETERMQLKVATDKGLKFEEIKDQALSGDLGGTVIPGGYQMDGIRFGPGVSDAMDYNPTDEAGASRAQKYQDASDMLSSKGASVEQAFLASIAKSTAETNEKMKTSERRRTPPVLPAKPGPANLRP